MQLTINNLGNFFPEICLTFSKIPDISLTDVFQTSGHPVYSDVYFDDSDNRFTAFVVVSFCWEYAIGAFWNVIESAPGNRLNLNSSKLLRMI